LTGINITGVITATSITAPNYGNVNSTALNVSGVSTFQASSFWGDGDVAYFGDGQDLLIFHNSTDSIIRDNGTGDLFIEGGNRIKVTSPTGIETYAVFNQDGAVELWYDNSKELETTGYGATVFGVLQSQGLQSSGISTFGVTSATNFTAQQANISGVSTFTGNVIVGSSSSITVGNAFIRNNQVGLGQTTQSGRDAGIGTAIGTIIYNSTNSKVEYYNGISWVSLKNNFDATGGTKTFADGKTIHTFTSSGTFTVNFGDTLVEYLVVAGGAGGANNHGGGGGAGGFRTGSGFPVSSAPGSYTVTVGSGGAGGVTPGQQGGSGSPSIFANPSNPITSTGGGGGSGRITTGSTSGAGNGGSGGGGAGTSPTAAGSGNTPPTSPPQGNNGGAGSTDPTAGQGGGGGGAGAAGGAGSGANNTGISGAGGNGTASSISGTSVTYAGGGSGGRWGAGTVGAAGLGGGGTGGALTSAGQNATAATTNTGGGGGGGGDGNGNGGNGGSGIVIISYPS
jgi:hypothetical protein